MDAHDLRTAKGREKGGKGGKGEKATGERKHFSLFFLFLAIRLETASMESLTWEAVKDEEDLRVPKGRKREERGVKRGRYQARTHSPIT